MAAIVARAVRDAQDSHERAAVRIWLAMSESAGEMLDFLGIHRDVVLSWMGIHHNVVKSWKESLDLTTMLLTEAIEKLCLATRANGRSLTTVQAYREKLGHLVAYLGDIPVESITTDDLRGYIVFLMDRPTLYAGHPTKQERTGKLSPFTVAGRVRAFKRLFNWLKEEGRIKVNPAIRIKTPQPKIKEPKAISKENFLAVLKTTAEGRVIDLRDRAIILFLADTGCRVKGICGLKVEDIDFNTGLALVTEKQDKTRFAPFNLPTAQAIKDWLEVRPQDKGPWLFVGLGNRAKDRITPNTVAKMLGIRSEQAGATGPCNAHAFRHAFAREFLLSGGDLATLSDLMGHSGVGVTKDFYARFTMRELKEKHKRHSPVAQIFGDNGGNGDGE